MSSFNIDSAIVIGFLTITFIVGLVYSTKINTIKDYALGDRNFNTSTLVSTLVATWVSGSLFVLGISETYSKGIIFILINVIGNLVSFVIVAFVFAPRMSEFLGTVSVASAMHSLYGKEVRIITAICGIISVAGYIAVQFKINAVVFGYFLGINDTIILMAILALPV